MAVFTPLTADDIISLLSDYAIGDYQTHHDILAGVENSNFHLTTTQGNFVLTLIERRITEAELPFILNYTSHLKAKGFTLSSPLPLSDGRLYSTFKNKLALITPFLKGAGVTVPDDHHIPKVATHLAKMHLASLDFTPTRKNDMHFDMWEKLILTCAQSTFFDFLMDELSYLERHLNTLTLPKGAVHADLFPDNLFFLGDSISGVIDFYFSCTDFYAYDLMLTINAWCFDGPQLNHNRLTTFLESYHAIRPLSLDEQNALPLLARAAALRIIATRLYAMLYPDYDAKVNAKNPADYIAILKYWQNATPLTLS
jgi:homoserine kinase type II